MCNFSLDDYLRIYKKCWPQYKDMESIKRLISANLERFDVENVLSVNKRLLGAIFYRVENHVLIISEMFCISDNPMWLPRILRKLTRDVKFMVTSILRSNIPMVRFMRRIGARCIATTGSSFIFEYRMGV